MPRSYLAILYASITYTLLFGAYYLLSGNPEFFWYVLVLLLFITVVTGTISTTRFSPAMLCALSLWGFMHMLGGSVSVDGDVLYRHVILPLYINGELSVLRFDQIVHFYGSATATFALFYLMKSVGEDRGEALLLFVSFVAGLGVGASNETVEFIVAKFLPYTTVGDYNNTGLDLIFNLFGVMTATILLFIRDHLPDTVKFEVRKMQEF